MTATASAALLLGACASPDARQPVSVGTSADIVALDPAATRDAATIDLLHQIYPRLLSRADDTGEYLPELAVSAVYSSETEFTVTLPSGLSFANGNELTASDVVFSFERQLAIKDASGPSSILAGIASVTALDASTVVFTTRRENDASLAAALAGPAGAILDEEVFSADAITDDEVIVAGGGFAGTWQLASFEGSVATLVGRDDDPAEPSGAVVRLETELEPSALVSRLAEGSLSAVFGPFSPEQSAELLATTGVMTRTQPSGALRMLAFDFATMPFGSATEDARPAAALAVREAIADLVDRDALAEVAPELWVPEYNFLPAQMRTGEIPLGTAPGEQGVLASFGDELGGPLVERAAERLADAKVETPVNLTIATIARTDDPAGEGLRAALTAQLEEGGLFAVEFVEVEGPFDRTTLSTERYPIVEYRWTPAGVGIDDYLSPLYSEAAGLPTGIADDRTEALLTEQVTTLDAADRAEVLLELEDRLAERLPTIPLVSGRQTIYLAPGMSAGAVEELGFDWFQSISRR